MDFIFSQMKEERKINVNGEKEERNKKICNELVS